MGFAAEMASRLAVGGSQVPLDDRELLISAFNHKSMDRIVTDDPADLTLEFLQSRHAFSVDGWRWRLFYSRKSLEPARFESFALTKRVALATELFGAND